MSRPRVAILDHPRSFFPLDVYEAISKEIEPVWVVSEPSMEANHERLLRRLGPVVDIAGRDFDAAAKAIAGCAPMGIVTFVDDLLVARAEIAARLGLRAHRPEVAAALVDKRGQRAALHRAGVPGPRFWSISASPAPEEIEIVADAARFPVVVKDAEGSGSRNMYRAADATQLRGLLGTPGEPERIVEEYLPDLPGRDPRFGGYVSVESMVQDGRLRHLAVIGRTPLAEPFRETGVFAPALPADVRTEVLEVGAAAAEALGVRNGMLHTEIKLTPNGPMVIEVNGRLGGTPPYVIREATGEVNLFAAACRLAIGAEPDLPDRLEFDRVAYWLVLQPPVWATRVTRLDGVRALSALDGVKTVAVNRHPGEAVDWRAGTLGHVMVVRGSVPDHRALADTLDQIHDTIVIEYAGEGAPAVARAER